MEFPSSMYVARLHSFLSAPLYFLWSKGKPIHACMHYVELATKLRYY